MTTTHDHVYVGLATDFVSDPPELAQTELDSIQAGRQWIASLDRERYSHLVALLGGAHSQADLDTLLDQMGAPPSPILSPDIPDSFRGDWRHYLFVMPLHAEGVNRCPLCPSVEPA